MTRALSRGEVAEAFISACKAELAALKPGNVHIHAAGHRMQVKDFERSAEVAAPHIANPRLKVGSRIRRAIDATIDAVGCNTNLGIVLLTAPLAAAAQRPAPLQKALAGILSSLDRNDAKGAFAAIRRAQPAGLGQVAESDVAGPAEITMLEAMHLAAGRDRISKAYVTEFADVFEFGLPKLRSARRRGGRIEDAVTALHMAYLARFTDSHILRKYGPTTASMVKTMARTNLHLSRPPIGRDAMRDLTRFDRDLKSQGLNPGTTADFVVATLFTETIILQRGGRKSDRPLSKGRSWR